MKNKKIILFCIIAISISLFSINISANDIWNGAHWYGIDGYDFWQYQEMYYFDIDNGVYEAYINDYDGDEIQQAFILSHDADETYYVYNTVTNMLYSVDITNYEVYINQNLYNYIIDEEGGQIPLENIINKDGAKEVFDICTDVTLETTFNILSAFFNNGTLTIYGWFCIMGLCLSMSIAIIKMVYHSERRL